MQAGHDDQQFVHLLRPLRGPLERYARRMLRNPSLAEDVLQESVIAALACFDQFTPGTNFKAWMFRFVTHRVLNANQKIEAVQMKDIPADLAIEDQWDPVESEESFELLLSDPDRFVQLLDKPLARALQQLTAPERACLLLESIGGFSYREIHELLEIPTGSVMGYLSRARQRLRLLLAEFAAEHGWTTPVDITTDANLEGGTPGAGGGERP